MIRAFPLLAVIGLIAAALGWSLAPQDFAGAWLTALTWFAAWSLGSLGLVLIHALTGGNWGIVLRPALLAGSRAVMLLVPLTIPLALSAGRLYRWLDAAPAGKGFYLNGPFFAGRAALYLIVWCGLALLAVSLDPVRLRRLAPGGLAALALTMSFAAIDTGMSLDLGFNSSVYGLIAMAGAALSALGAAILATAVAAEDRPDLGRLLLGLVVFWAYLDFMQFLIVWESDLTRETPWYLARSHGFWGGVAALLGLGHFALPFALLLSGRAKARREVLLGTAALLVVLEMLREAWLILPSLQRLPGWIDAAALLAMAGLAGTCLFAGPGGFALRRAAR